MGSEAGVAGGKATSTSVQNLEPSEDFNCRGDCRGAQTKRSSILTSCPKLPQDACMPGERDQLSSESYHRTPVRMGCPDRRADVAWLPALARHKSSFSFPLCNLSFYFWGHAWWCLGAAHGLVRRGHPCGAFGVEDCECKGFSLGPCMRSS